MAGEALNFLRNIAAGRDGACWAPLLSVYYLTYRCSFRCPYCSDGSGRPYYALKNPEPSWESACATLAAIRRHCENVVITGGEPLEYQRLGEVMNRLPAMRFRNSVFTTNGHALEPLIEHVAPVVTDLVFSLDTLDGDKADGWYGTGAGTLERILLNISAVASSKSRKARITISSVVTPENIDDLYGVCEFALGNGFSFAACPQLIGVKVHEGLKENPGYGKFYEFLISRKKAGHKIFGTVRYLEHMRDLKKFECRPFAMLTVGPDGGVFYPCLEIGKPVGNISDVSDLDLLRVRGERLFGPQPACGNQCQSACALSFSLLFADPFIAFGEAYYTMKGFISTKHRRA